MAISLSALIPLPVWVCSSPYSRSKWAPAFKKWIINTQPVGLQLWLLMGSGLMKSPCFSDKLVYQKVNLVEKKIYSPLALAVARLILTVRILFFLFWVTLSLLSLYPIFLFSLPTQKVVLQVHWWQSHICHLQIIFLIFETQTSCICLTPRLEQ